MCEKHFEINGNLYNKISGIKNCQEFGEVIGKIKCLYDKIFGPKIMNKYDLYVDNATENSGYAPIITPVLQKYLIIKLSIYPNDRQSRIAFQFSHELTHFVFYSYFGINKKQADFMEEMICTAASLIIIKNLFPDELDDYNDYLKNVETSCYREGPAYAESIQYSFEELKNRISNLKYD
ncbi:hypothetical protein [Clostridium perfringens]|uniref:hypothetical protein n=1 Tax=Clostridium perfringens TaxID=1502 RepID=UPI0008A6D498|nr:hypothetical protein [Clostridium perfringens]AOY53336.1 hypothetical protein FORC25_0918 [Clostridium perfringens]MDK0679974.1 hypothetical protein [Clostridium perfringens]MDK0856442.1 hypothetical protein [Clostridium perfringens]UUW66894.1 hypothetical protein NQ197_04745 [Clostridium perfringens]